MQASVLNIYYYYSLLKLLLLVLYLSALIRSLLVLLSDDDREDAREKRFRSLFGLKSKGDINSSSRRLAKLAPQSSSPNPSSSCALPLPLIDTSLL
jgi:hypothetical protein